MVSFATDVNNSLVLSRVAQTQGMCAHEDAHGAGTPIKTLFQALYADLRHPRNKTLPELEQTYTVTTEFWMCWVSIHTQHLTLTVYKPRHETYEKIKTVQICYSF